MNTLGSSIGPQWPSCYDVFGVMASNRDRLTFDEYVELLKIDDIVEFRPGQ